MTRIKPEVEVEPETQISDQFNDLKRSLATVSADQWANLPEVGDLTRRNKRQRQLLQSQQRSYAMPDSILSGLASSTATETSIVDEETDFESISRARDQMLGHQLDRNAGETASVDSAAYLQADTESFSTDEISDMQKTRSIFRSLRKTAPHVPRNWIMSARLEESARKYDAARRLINEGCLLNKFSEDVWMESLRIHGSQPKQQKLIISEALKFNGSSVRLWQAAIALETEKSRVVRKAIEANPGSSELWKAAVGLEPAAANKTKLLRKAVSLIPQSIDLWLMLIDGAEELEAKKQWLGEARKYNPRSHEIWLAAMKLEEGATGNEVKIERLFNMAIRRLEMEEGTNTQGPDKDTWIAIAMECESLGFPLCCEIITRTVLERDISSKNYTMEEESIIADCVIAAQNAVEGDYPQVARSIYAVLSRQYPTNIDVWLHYTGLERRDIPRLHQVFQEALKFNSESELLWLMYAKSRWQDANDVTGAEQVLQEALGFIPHNEEVWLAKIKLATATGDFTKAKAFFAEARGTSVRLWYKNVHFLRFMGMRKEAETLVEEGLRKFPGCEKLHLQRGQIETEDPYAKAIEGSSAQPPHGLASARNAYLAGTKQCPSSLALWTLLALTDEHLGVVIRARSTLDQAILKNPTLPELWVAKIRLENRQNNVKQARAASVAALSKFPHSAAVWCEYLPLCEKASQRKNGMMDALLKTGNSSRILCFIGVQFWKDGKFTKARTWFDRAVKADPANGDHWAWYYTFMQQKLGGEMESFMAEFEQVELINEGECWNATAKAVENYMKDKTAVLIQVSQLLRSQSVYQGI
ncbi:hypothetical protein BABINDRAFT_55446 [Babjeviella inositovora NRRL Y-12698]|uniref:PRP1 splicing factor N-terminal domain-containing protein n=1 Tax=Babjeviella inositovora NRRL Y-12698 TaxID=984486 RepID=A0A1E3QIW8_9ASCO|nr:uncharacterized protein BABINDRAFT_55446 [Babjeviella inositovora NRRL Y-12698]ODQ76927.1 hypothetical protein BABINDRAFT_55446 [Babjeviella inositovora NRRL Y-12698]